MKGESGVFRSAANKPRLVGNNNFRVRKSAQYFYAFSTTSKIVSDKPVVLPRPPTAAYRRKASPPLTVHNLGAARRRVQGVETALPSPLSHGTVPPSGTC